jgi:hypothetical protein
LGTGIPIAKLLEEKKAGALAGGAESIKGAILAGTVDWNDFSLGLMSRLRLWQATAWPSILFNSIVVSVY